VTLIKKWRDGYLMIRQMQDNSRDRGSDLIAYKEFKRKERKGRRRKLNTSQKGACLGFLG
jgi:hypothetical protein